MEGKIMKYESMSQLAAALAWLAEHGDAATLVRVEVDFGPMGQVTHEYAPTAVKAEAPKAEAVKAPAKAKRKAKAVKGALYACAECDKVTTAAGLGVHQKYTGHKGRTLMGAEPTPEPTPEPEAHQAHQAVGRWACAAEGCSVVSTAGGLGAHQHATGHTGRTPVVVAA